MKPMSEQDLYWLAGLLEGEGSFVCYSSPTIQLGMTDKDVVEKAANLMNTTMKTYPAAKKHWKTRYHANLHGQDAIVLLSKLLPLMGNRRSDQIKTVLQKADERPGPRRGEKHKQSKLKASDIPLIKYLHNVRGISKYKLAKHYGVRDTTIRSVIIGKTWKHIKDELPDVPPAGGQIEQF